MSDRPQVDYFLSALSSCILSIDTEHKYKRDRIVDCIIHSSEPHRCVGCFQKLGKLYISSCIEKDARRLTITIIKADDLPKGGITGPPGLLAILSALLTKAMRATWCFCHYCIVQHIISVLFIRMRALVAHASRTQSKRLVTRLEPLAHRPFSNLFPLVTQSLPWCQFNA